MPGFSRGICVSSFQTKTLYEFHSSLTHVSCPTNLKHFNLIIRLVYVVRSKPFSYSLSNFLHSPITPPLLGPNIFLSTRFSKILSLCSSLSIRDKHPCQATGRTTVLFILILTSLIRTVRQSIQKTDW